MRRYHLSARWHPGEFGGLIGSVSGGLTQWHVPRAIAGIVFQLVAWWSHLASAQSLPEGPSPKGELRWAEYDIEQEIEPSKSSFAGRARIRFVNLTGSPLQQLPILLHPNEAREQGAKAASQGELEVFGVECIEGPKPSLGRSKASLANLRFEAPIPPGGAVRFIIKYRGRFGKVTADANNVLLQAFGAIGQTGGKATAIDYGLLANGDGILTMASAYPTVAPFRDGRFDTSRAPLVGDSVYNRPSQFRVKTTIPADYRIATNLVDRTNTRIGDGRTIVESDGYAVRDLVLVGAADYTKAQRLVGRIPVISYFRQRDRKVGMRVLDLGVASLASLQKRFGTYPWPELHLAESTIIGGAGGVEFCGMALIAAMHYVPPNLASTPFAGLVAALGSTKDISAPVVESLKGQLDFVVAHEVAHQYFAGILGNDSRRHAVVDEPLAQFGAYLILSDLVGEDAARIATERNIKINYAMARALGYSDGPADRDSHAFRSNIEYAGLVYGKAPFAYLALQNRMGVGALDAAIRDGIREVEFGLTSTDDWIRTLASKSGAHATEVKIILGRYFREARGDEDLKLGDPADYVVGQVLPPEVSTALSAMGLSAKSFLNLFTRGQKQSVPSNKKLPSGVSSDAELLKLLQDQAF